APVGEDQDAAGARRLDEAHRGDGLAGAGGVLEPKALVGVGVVGRALGNVLVDVRAVVVLPGLLRLLPGLLVLVLVFVVVLVLGGLLFLDREDRLGRRRRGTVPVLGGGQQRGQRAGQRVDLVGVEQRPVGKARLLLAEQPLEAEQQCVAAAPLRRRDLGA